MEAMHATNELGDLKKVVEMWIAFGMQKLMILARDIKFVW